MLLVKHCDFLRIINILHLNITFGSKNTSHSVRNFTGYEYEVEACARAIAQGEKECPEMPHDETVRVMGIMDGIRKSWGYEIPLYE